MYILYCASYDITEEKSYPQRVRIPGENVVFSLQQNLRPKPSVRIRKLHLAAISLHTLSDRGQTDSVVLRILFRGFIIAVSILHQLARKGIFQADLQMLLRKFHFQADFLFHVTLLSGLLGIVQQIPQHHAEIRRCHRQFRGDLKLKIKCNPPLSGGQILIIHQGIHHQISASCLYLSLLIFQTFLYKFPGLPGIFLRPVLSDTPSDFSGHAAAFGPPAWR